MVGTILHGRWLSSLVPCRIPLDELSSCQVQCSVPVAFILQGRTVSANDQVGRFLRHKLERCFWLMFLGTTAIKPSTIIIMVRWHYLGHSVFLFVVNQSFIVLIAMLRLSIVQSSIADHFENAKSLTISK